MIRPALPEDADAVHALVCHANTPWIARLGREPSPMRDDYAQRIASGEVWVLEETDALLGCIMLRDGPEALQIPNIAVVPAAQGKGHGRQLLAFAEAEARRRGYQEVRLTVNMLMTENIALYQHLGFVESRRIQGDSIDRVYACMTKPIAHASGA
jgi:ribosomal protein S18 acetylase RimI-like enzyme